MWHLWLREVPPSVREDACQEAEARKAFLLAKTRPGLEDSFIVEQDLVDAQQDVAAELMSWEELRTCAAGQ